MTFSTLAPQGFSWAMEILARTQGRESAAVNRPKRAQQGCPSEMARILVLAQNEYFQTAVFVMYLPEHWCYDHKIVLGHRKHSVTRLWKV